MNQEVSKRTETKISCTITEIGSAMTITWSGYDAWNDNYLVEYGIFNANDNSQTSSITIKSEAVVADSEFSCSVSSAEMLASESKNFIVQLFVYGNYNRFVSVVIEENGLVIQLIESRDCYIKRISNVDPHYS